MSQSLVTNIFLDQSEDPIWMIDLNFQLIYANKSYLNIVKEVTGKEQHLNESALIEDFDEGYTKKWKSYYERALAGEKFEIEEHVSNPETNDIKYGQITFNPIVGDDQKVFAITCQSRDISNIIKNKSEANQLIDASLDVFCTINEQGNFVSVSAASLNLWGFSPAELIGKDYQDFILEEDLPKTIKIASAIFNGQDIKSFTNRYIKKDGGIAYNLWSVKWDARTRLTYCVAREAQEIIEKEEKILHSEQRFRALVQEGSDMIAIFDPEGNYIYASPSSMSILGIPQKEFIGRNAFDFIHPEDSERVLESLNKIVTEEQVSLAPFRFQNDKKEWRWLETVLTNMLDNSAVNGIVANSRDVTEEKKLRRLNQQANLLSKIGSWEVDLLNKTVFWTNEVHHLHDTDPSTYIPTFEEAINFYREDFREMVKANVEQCIATGETYVLEAVLITAKKRELWVRSNASAEFVDGVCTRIYGSIQDIDARKQSEKKLQSLSENLPGVVYEYLIYPDGTDNLIDISGAVEQIWGISASEALENVSVLWDQVKAGGDYNQVKADILKSIQTKTKWTSRYRYVMPNGEVRIHLGKGIPTLLIDGTVKFNSMIFDITKEAKNEELLEQITKIARIGSWELELENQNEDYMYWSPMLYEIVEVEETYNPTLTGGIEFHIGESKERIKKALDLLITDGTEFDEEILLLTAKGNERWSRAIGRSEIVNGVRTKIYGSYQDITERKKAEEEKFSLQKTLENSLNEIYIFDAQKFQFSYVNKGALLNLGYSENEIKALTPLDIKPNFTEKSFKQLIEPLVSSEKNKIIFFTNHERKDRSQYPVEVHLQLLSEGNNKRFIAVILDITDRKKAEDEDRFKANLLSTIGQAAIATNLDGVVTYWNKAAENIYGWKQYEAIGKNIMHLTPVETNKEEATQIMEALKKGQTWSGEFEVQKKDGTIFPALISNSPIYDENKAISGMIGISSDITQKVKYEKLLKQHTEELERSNTALKKIAWTQSHVVRAPIARILAVINLLEEQPDSFEEISFWVKQLKISTCEMDEIVKKIISETNN